MSLNRLFLDSEKCEKKDKTPQKMGKPRNARSAKISCKSNKVRRQVREFLSLCRCTVDNRRKTMGTQHFRWVVSPCLSYLSDPSRTETPPVKGDRLEGLGTPPLKWARKQLGTPVVATHHGRRQRGEGGWGVGRSNRGTRVFLLDVNPLCYDGKQPSLYSFAYWITLFLSRVVNQDPIVAVFDGEDGNEYRRQLLPSYKAHRRRFSLGLPAFRKFSRTQNIASFSAQNVMDLFHVCNIPVVKVEHCEADDVIATLAAQVQQRGIHTVVASPDKDFKQLISKDVQMVVPMPDLGRWSFYTLKHYHSQYDCDPRSDLSLRCILGDDVDGVPGLQHMSPGFGRKTAVKLIKKHGTLENLLSAAAVRTVGKPYAQNALTEHADYLRRNFRVLSLRRDIDVQFNEEWLSIRDTSTDLPAISRFFKKLK